MPKTKLFETEPITKRKPTEEEIVKFVVGKYDLSKNYHQPLKDNRDIYYQYYRGIPDSKKYDWQSNLFIPITAKQVDSTLSDIAPALLGVQPPFDVLPRESNDREQAKILKSLLEYQWERDGAYIKVISLAQQAIMYGTAVGKVIWDAKADEPTLEPLDIYNVYPDPDAIDIQDSWVIHREERNLHYLKRLEKEGIYKNVDKITDKTYKMADDSRLERRQTIGLSTPSEKAKPIEVFEFWGLYDIDNDGEEENCVITVANKQVLLRSIEYPFLHGENPFVKINYIKVPNEFFGIGIPERIRGLQEELNDVRNQRMDNVNLIINAMFVVDKNADVNLKDCASRPGGIIRTNDVNAVRELRWPDATASAYKEEGIIKDDAQDATGSYEYAYGASPARQETATGIIRLQSAASKRFAIIARIMEQEGIKEIVKKFYQLDLQFIDRPRIIRIIGEEGENFKEVTPEDIKGNFDFIPTGMAGLVQKETQINQLIQALNIGAGIPEIDPLEIFKKLWELWGFKNFEKLRRSLPPQAGMGEGVPEDEQRAIDEMVKRGIDPNIIKEALREKDRMMGGVPTKQPYPERK